ncbi:MAG: hypothetical protein HEP71_26750 [Roseivirga sp.]|nr:hypothetical protein [Roseivirga sp.]
MLNIYRVPLLFILILTSCGLSQNKEDIIHKYYSDNEIAQLDKLIDFVIKEVSKDCNQSITDCFMGYFQQFEDLAASAEIEPNLSVSKQKALLNQLAQPLFEDIWTFNQWQRSVEIDSVQNILVLSPRHDGKFARFLIEVTKNHDKLAGYGNTFKEMGDYMPSMNGQLIQIPQSFNFESKDELLLLVIHLLTLNHPPEIL